MSGAEDIVRGGLRAEGRGSEGKKKSLPIFELGHGPDAGLIGECVHCGFCLPACPTYQLWGEEADSPRGRIYLMKLGLEGEAVMDAGYVKHFDQCLGCMACVTACPSGVKYDELIEATRGGIERRYERGAWEKFLRGVIFAVFPRPWVMRVLAVPLWVYQRTGLEGVVRGSGVLRWFPERVRMMEGLAPRVAMGGGAHMRHGFGYKPVAPAGTPVAPRRKVGMMLGCVQRVFFGGVNGATMRVLEAEGCEVVVPRGQGCCGALMLHAGEEEKARELARGMIDAFEGVETVVINAAGCGSAMKEYGRLLRDDAVYREKARVFAGKCRDISEVLGGMEPVAERKELKWRVAYHDACHLQHAQGITREPRELLRGIPGVEVLEMEDAGMCCGSAGIYNILQPGAAGELGRRKARSVINTGADVVVSGNPGCTLQLQKGLRELGSTMVVMHWVELLDAAISGVPGALGALGGKLAANEQSAATPVPED